MWMSQGRQPAIPVERKEGLCAKPAPRPGEDVTVSAPPGTFAGALHCPASFIDETRLSFAELARKFACHSIDRDVYVAGGFLREDVASRDGQMDFSAEAFLRIDCVIVDQDDVSGNDIREILELSDHGGGVLMQRR
jgi:hypothetical protein